MKIKIISLFRNECNYGQRLQEYSLYTFLKSRYNFDVKLLDPRKVLPTRECKDKNKILKFKKFENEYIELEEFNGNNKSDYYVCGSDQVFNWYDVKTNVERDYFTFEWIVEKNKILTYAASYDLKLCNKKEYDIFFHKLSYINNISLREFCNINHLKKYCPCSYITSHIDPVFLLDKNDWLKIQLKPSFVDNKKFDFVYTTYTLSFKLNSNCYYCSCIGDDIAYKSEIGPREFLWLLNNCEIFYTNSFHGYCLAKILHKQCFNILNLNDNDFRYNNLKQIKIDINMDSYINQTKRYFESVIC